MYLESKRRRRIRNLKVKAIHATNPSTPKSNPIKTKVGILLFQYIPLQNVKFRQIS
jgi:hypothetical protein